MTIAKYGDIDIPVIKDNALKYTLVLLTDPETGDSKWFFYDEETDTFSDRVEMTADEAMEYANLLSDYSVADEEESGMSTTDKILFIGLGGTVAALAVAIIVLQAMILRKKKRNLHLSEESGTEISQDQLTENDLPEEKQDDSDSQDD